MSKQSIRWTFFVLLLAFNASSVLASPSTFPCIVNGPANADNESVLAAAKLAFRSKEREIYDAAKDIRGSLKNLVLWPGNEADIGCDTTVFDRSPASGVSKLYVQKKPFEDLRYIVRQKPFNWQGDFFNIFVTTSKDTSEEIFKKLDAIEMDRLPAGYAKVTDETWQRPWILKSPVSGRMLAVDTQHPALVMGDWIVYVADKQGEAKEACRIRFREPSKEITDLLPKGPISQIAFLLDDIIGKPKPNEGTLNATARLRGSVAHMWGNLLFRPWAMTQPERTRAQVEAFLKRWQGGSRSYGNQYVRLQSLYPRAQVALTSYYEQSMKLSKTEAEKLAAKNLDIAYRSHFTF